MERRAESCLLEILGNFTFNVKVSSRVQKRDLGSIRVEKNYLILWKEELIGDDHIKGELGEVLLGRVPGRVTDDEITLFKSVGLAVEDLASAYYAYRKAETASVGTREILS